MTTNDPLTAIKGVGAATATTFAQNGLNTIEDLLYFLPRRYNDFSHITPISQAKPGIITVKAKVEKATGRYVKRRMHIAEAVLDDGTAKMKAVWFNQPYRVEYLQKAKDDEWYFSGTFDFVRNRYILSNPSVERVADFAINTARIVPIYPETKGIRSTQMRRMIRELQPLMHMLPETLPGELIKREKLLDINKTLLNLHFPEDEDKLVQARERMGFEELLELLIAALLNKKDNAALQSYHIPFRQEAADTFTKSLPFTMTSAQKRSAWEILQDFERPHPMNRMVQGDVGSGKTAVAAMAAYMATQSGFQTALMAPTEILATQHANTLSSLLQPLGIEVVLLVGSVKPKAREALYQRIESGEVHIVVGTHALIQKHVNFHKLGFVIIDEQHRFGVDQRAELLKKSEHMPHMLSMTATPIPRSLQLTVYGELEISIIDELPAGRQAIKTQVCSPFGRKVMYAAIDAQIAEGRQAYVVCPTIEASAQAELKSVQEEYKKLKESIFSHRRLGLLHGQMKPDEKEAVMAQFKAGELDILISTTVIEVGVDVPNATVMLIEGAERFGLAQLHQLRGRVGRGSHQSYCYLMPSSGKKPSERLMELEKSQDGFYLSEVDLRLRGPGEIYGRMQHGALNLRVASVTDTKLIKRVRTAAEWLLDSGIDLLQYKQLYRRVGHYRRLTSLN